jgi:endoglucanase
MTAEQTTQIGLPVKKIKVNQVGYTPSEKKIFLYTTTTKSLEGKGFQVIRASDGKVFKGRLSKSTVDKDSGDRNYNGDFSFLTEPGKYTIKINSDESYPFEITDQKYHDLFYITMRSYYLQRCGMEINDTISGVSHAACHLDDSYPDDKPLGSLMDTTGGWHDAGDYGKYIPSAAVTLAQLLLIYELSPKTFDRLSLDIPKTKADEPFSDILLEIKYELDWMLKMQDTKDGGVFYKVSSYEFPPIDMAPEDDNVVRYYYRKGTAITANFVGAIAIAARVFEKTDLKYAERLRKAAIQAGDFLVRTNGEILEPSIGKTGAYLTTSVKGALCWAYAELYRLTGEQNYLDMVQQNWENSFVPIIGWDNVSFLAVYTLLAYPKTPDELRKKWLNIMIQWAESIRARISLNGYHVALVWDEYVWASVKTALAYGVSLILVQELLSGKDFEDEIKSPLDYVLGVNPLSKVYITKVGTDYVYYPHHRLVESKRILVPGLVVGGPNNWAEDGFYPSNLGPKGYIDLTNACSCNEYAIDYNAPFVFIVGYLWMIAEEQKTKYSQ